MVSFNYIRDAHIVLPTSAPVRNASAAISNIQHCVVDMSSIPEIGRSFANFVIKYACESLLICGKVDGAAHLTGITDSVIVVTCQQFRMHDCANVDVYLSCASKPIIEDCVAIRFSPLPESYVSGFGSFVLPFHADRFGSLARTVRSRISGLLWRISSGCSPSRVLTGVFWMKRMPCRMRCGEGYWLIRRVGRWMRFYGLLAF